MSDRVLRGVLRLHPAKYRREWGEEIAAVFADTTAGAGRWATARELFDLAGHGVRARLGLTSSGTLARLAAMVAPFAAAAAAGISLMNLYVLARAWLRHGAIALWVPYTAPYYYGEWIQRGGEALFLAAAVAAVLGRWTAARLLALLAPPLMIASWYIDLRPYLAHHHTALIRELVGLFVVVGPQLLWVLLLLAAPRDLLGPATWRRGLAALAGVLVGGVFWGQATMFQLFRSLPSFDFVILKGFPVGELLLLMVAVPTLRRGRYVPAAVALAGAPLVLVALVALVHDLWSPYNRDGALAMLGVLGAVAVVGVVVVVAVESRWRPSTPDRRPPAAG